MKVWHQVVLPDAKYAFPKELAETKVYVPSKGPWSSLRELEQYKSRNWIWQFSETRK